MGVYEYKCMPIGDPSRAPADTEKLLNEQAAQGWRVVTVVIGRYGVVSVLERRLEPDDAPQQVKAATAEQSGRKRKT